MDELYAGGGYRNPKSGHKVWHAGNDGSGSGLDADLLDGKHASEIASSAIPSGAIVMWSGSTSNIPSGWALCNGANGTPDLRDRFIVGAGNSYPVGATGGANSVTLTTSHMPAHGHTASTNSTGAHTHSGSTNTTGSHTHRIYNGYNSGSTASIDLTTNSSSTLNWSSRCVEASGSHSHTITATSAGAHTHTVTVNSSGSGAAHENRPPYYALCFIMKL